MKTQKMNVRNYWNQWSAWIRKICFGEMDKVVKQKTPLSSGRNENPDEVLFSLETFLTENYEFRYNQLKDCTEFRKRNTHDDFIRIDQRGMNTLCLEAKKQGINCWDRDVSRFVYSFQIPSYHPFLDYMKHLPQWDGQDRITGLAKRISNDRLWIQGFRLWMLGMAAQWTGKEMIHANALVPLLISRQQGLQKSTFCKLLVPNELQAYYTDSFDLASPAVAEQKLALFGLINLDEFDKISEKKMPLLKNLLQMSRLNIRKSHQSNFSSLPRVASFIGTSNQKELLTDPTGSRRFLCIEVNEEIDSSPIDHAQLYAQLKTLLEQGERYWMNKEEEAAWKKVNQSFYRISAEEDVFNRYYHKPLPGESIETYSAAEIYRRLKQKSPESMRNVSVQRLAQTLSAIGIERIHTRYGNLYRVVSHPSQ